MSNIEILPAILPADDKELKDNLARVRGLVPSVQIDVLDGRFVTEKSWPFHTEDKQYFKKLADEAEGLPFWQDFSFEADLMITEPEKHIDDFIFAGFARLVVHIESTNKMSEIISRAHDMDTEICIAIDVETPNSELEEYIDMIDGVQFMGIANIGYQGEPFDARVVEKIRELKSKFPDIIISVDGGVTLKTAPALIGAGASRLVSGSAIFGSEDPERTIEQFYTIQKAVEEKFE